MTKRNDNREVLKLDLKLNLSPPRTQWPVMTTTTESPNRSSPITISPTNSCVSLELETADHDHELRYSSSPETTSMMLAGCPRCLMYVMLADEDYPKCPKCKSTVLLDVLLDKPIKKMRN
uniref:protein GL2-INTERACTING REPRESSOR 1-like n=1 Tax=Erigeron canadensis TaxID=72917 RepID=UPI001CB8E7A2|nr:protein GL2-INTERACTING REPRESSOR 1-like [Erigeron canadensis]